MDRKLFLAATVGLVTLAGVCGCGGGNSNVGYVSGTVTLDGQPVPNALITFVPTKGGSPSNARTDSSGEYVLSYTRDVEGAEIGEHTIKVSTFQPANPDEEPPTPAVPEKIPAKYNTQSELKKEVTSGSNEINIELKLDGPVVQPSNSDD